MNGIVPAPAVAVTVPPQVFTRLGTGATKTLAGRFSVNCSPDCAGLPAPLVTTKVIVETPPRPITVGRERLGERGADRGEGGVHAGSP